METKIVYVMDRYTGSGGIERVISLKANYLVSKGYKVYIISCYNSDEPQPSFFYFDPKIEFFSIGTKSLHKKYKKEVIGNLTAIFRNINPDIVISTGIRSLNYIGEIKDGSKKIIEYHFSLYKRKFRWAVLEKSWLGKQFLKLLFYRDFKNSSKFDEVVTLTEEDRVSRLIYPLKRVHVIPNPNSFQAEKPSTLTSKRIIAIGRFESQKGFDRLIKIWQKIEKDYPEWELVVFGEGRKKNQLQKLIRELHLDKRVSLVPPVKDIQKEILNSSILAVSSRYEGLGMIILEAFACGVPVVAFAFKCGPRDLINNGVDSFYAEMDDEEGFISYLRTLIENEELRHQFGKSIYEKSKDYEIEKVMQKWMNLFDKVLKSE